MNTDVVGAGEAPTPSLVGLAEVQLRVGSCIQGKYLVHGVLGLGGFAVVYDAEHVGLGRRVAVKVMHLAADTPLALLERFRREARISALANHRNVLEVYDTGTLYDGSPYLVMERVNGENLSDLLRRGPLSLAGAVEVVRQLLCGLCALEEAGIVHRDIKPDNLMLHDAGDGEPVVKLVDFGIAKRVVIEAAAKLTCHGTLVGTPQYMSPEQIRGQDVDLRTDLYATGALLYEALSGHAPHESQNFSELVVAVLNAPLRPLRELRANCPAELDRIATKALSRSAALRYASPREMLAELEACAAELELPRGAEAFRYEDPIDPIWMTSPRMSLPVFSRRWLRGAPDLRRPAQLAAGLLLLAVSGAALQMYRTELPVRAVASAVLQGKPVERPSRELPFGREPPAQWSTGSIYVARPPLAPLRAQDDSTPAPLVGSFPPSSVRLEVRQVDSEPHVRKPREASREASREPTMEVSAAVSTPIPAPALRGVEAPNVVEREPVDRPRWERAMDRALASMVRGELVEARVQYLAATKLDRDEPAAFRGLALVCARLGERDEAHAALQRYLALTPDAADAAMLRTRVHAAAN